MPKIDIENFVYFGRLFEIYGKLLSTERQSVMDLYFNCNMTLAEIAEERKISRQAVLDAIEKSCEKLQVFEKALCICHKRQKIVEELNEVLDLAKSSSKKTSLKNSKEIEIISKKVENILKEI